MRNRFGLAAVVFSVAMAVGWTAWGQQAKDPVKEFFWYQCYICHVSNDPYEACTEARSHPTTTIRQRSDETAAMSRRDPAEGLFMRVQNAHGPDLCGVFGQPAGRRAKEGYKHSPSFQEQAPSVVWTEENLDKYLTDTRAFIPGAWMFVKIPDPQMRKGLIEFLKTYK